MKILYFLTLSYILFFTNMLLAQQFLGGELNRFFSGKNASAWVFLQTQDVHVPFAEIKWGDGTATDTLVPLLWYMNTNGDIITEFSASHSYEEFGEYSVQLNPNGYWSSNIVNVENPHSIPFKLSEQITIDNDISNWPPPFFVDPFNTDHINEEGALAVVLSPEIGGGGEDSVTMELIPVLEEGYHFPAASEYLECCLTWKNPIEPGLYAFAVKASSWDNGILQGTATRYFSINVDSSMLVSNENILFDRKLFLYPNPSHDLINLNLEHISLPASMIIYNAQGQQIHSAPIRQENNVLEVASWPRGIYFLTMYTEGALLTRKFVVE
jgi:hypothetical protein